jgi:deoxyhypusine synthase
MSVSGLIETAFLGSTAGQLAAAAQLLTARILARPDTLVGLSLDAALIAGGTAVSTLVPLLRGGYVDWLAITGSNLYYDALFSLRKPLLPADAASGDDLEDCGGGVCIRRSDRQSGEAILREILSAPEFQRPMSSAAMHSAIGRQLRGHEKELGVQYPSLLSSAHELDVPVFNPSPADNALGSIVADLAEVGNRLLVDPNRDLNQTAAILNGLGASEGGCAAWCLGRGAASDFMLAVPAHLERILGPRARTAYTARLRMAGRVHELPGATRDPVARSQPLPASDVTVSTDLSVALPVLVAHILDRVPPRPLKRLDKRREDLLDKLREDRLQATLKGPQS